MSGRAWVFGDDINTDALAPGLYMKEPLEVLARHCLEAIDPDFAREVGPDDVIVGGRNFGIGSSREQAAQVLQMLGVKAIIARSFAGIFHRNALNFGVIALTCEHTDEINSKDILSVNAAAGTVRNQTQNSTYSCDALPDQLLEMVTAGGLVPYLKTKLRKETR